MCVLPRVNETLGTSCTPRLRPLGDGDKNNTIISISIPNFNKIDLAVAEMRGNKLSAFISFSRKLN